MKIFVLILLLLGLCTYAAADVSVSKSNTYSVLAPPDGAISVSKSNTYSVLSPPDAAISIGKSNTYSVLAPPDGSISISKVNTYVVLDTTVRAGGLPIIISD